MTWAERAAIFLNGVPDPQRREDLREHFEERAAICEFDGNMARDDAERIAYAEINLAARATQESGRVASPKPND